MKTPLLLSTCFLLAGCSASEEALRDPLVTVMVAPVERADVRLSVRAPATLYPLQQASIAARITAPLRAVRARQGDYVTAGQVLAELEDRDLLAQRKEAQARVIDAEASLQKISAGTLPSDIERARGQLATAEAVLNQAQQIFDRRRELFDQGAIPNRELLLSRTELEKARIASDVAERSLDLLLNQSREKEIQIAHSRLDQVRARLEWLDVQIEFTRIRSPFPGTLVKQFQYPGDMAKPDTPIFTLIDFSKAVARAQVPEAEVAAIRVGQEGRFVPADAMSSSYSGRVSVVSRAVDPTRRTVEVWCEISRPDPSLRAGMYGSLTLFTGEAPGSILVPLSAVQFKEGTRTGFVMLVDKEHRARRREVEAGETFGKKVRILRGLAPGERVIVEGAYGLPEGTKVKLEEGKPL